MIYIKGLDISAIQGLVDFDWIKQQGIEFIILRCGVGNDYNDNLYTHNVTAAKAVGLKVMAYHFAYPLPDKPGSIDRNPIDQARRHFKAAQGELACLDIEWPEFKDWGKWGCSASQINQWTLDYLKEYEKLSGKKIPVYTYPSFANLVKFSPEIIQHPLWIASYQQTPYIPKPWVDWAMWQTEGGKLFHLPNGTPVDTNVIKDWSLWGETSVEVPATSPQLPPNEPEPVQPTIPAPESPKPPEPSLEDSKEPSGNLSSFLLQILEFILKLMGIKK